MSCTYYIIQRGANESCCICRYQELRISRIDLHLPPIFFCKGALFWGKGGSPVLEKPTRHLPRQGRGFVRPSICPTPPAISSPYGRASGGQLTDCWHQMSSGCCMNLFMSFTDQVMSGSGIWFFIMSTCSEEVASQSVIRWWRVSLACRHNLHVGSISGLSLDWKYAKLLCPVILLILTLSQTFGLNGRTILSLVRTG